MVSSWIKCSVSINCLMFNLDNHWFCPQNIYKPLYIWTAYVINRSSPLYLGEVELKRWIHAQKRDENKRSILKWWSRGWFYRVTSSSSQSSNYLIIYKRANASKPHCHPSNFWQVFKVSALDVRPVFKLSNAMQFF